MRFSLALYRGDEAGAESISRRLAATVRVILDDMQHFYGFAWLRLLQRADPDLARQVYWRLCPELLQEEPRVDAWNHSLAIGLVDGMRRAGDSASADSLLERALSVLRGTTDPWCRTARVAAYLLRGQTQRALAELREAEYGGTCWWLLEREPIYEPMWDHPDFRSRMAEIKAHTAAQLEQLREMERRREIVLSPEQLPARAHAWGSSPPASR